MARISRRQFVKRSLQATSALALSGMFRPSFVYGQGAGTGKIYIAILLNGGLDDLSMFVPIETTVKAALDARRPTIKVTNPIQVHSQIGLHPKAAVLQPLFAEGACKLGRLVGITEQGGHFFNGSHEVCKSVYSAGRTDISAGTAGGWMRKLIDRTDLDGSTVYGIDTGNLPDFDGGDKPVTVLPHLDQYNVDWQWSYLYGDNVELRHARDVARQLTTVPGHSPLGQKVDVAIAQLYKSLDEVALIRQLTMTGAYPATWFGGSVRDIAKIIKYRMQNGFSNKNHFFVTMMGGVPFDTHSSQAPALGGDANYMGLIEDISRSIAGLVTDLKALNVWSNSVINMYSEFGRGIEENGGNGTDHGFAATQLVLGGRVNGAGANMVTGTGPTAAQLSTQNLLEPKIDFRNFPDQILRWMGYDTGGLFQSFNPTDLQLFR